MAIVPGTQRTQRSVGRAARPTARPVLTAPRARPRVGSRPVAPRAGGARSSWHWLWAAVALAVGLFIAAAGWIAWVVGPVVTVAALVSLVTHRRWSHPALWIGLGLTLGVLLHIVLRILHDTGGPGTPLLP